MRRRFNRYHKQNRHYQHKKHIQPEGDWLNKKFSWRGLLFWVALILGFIFVAISPIIALLLIITAIIIFIGWMKDCPRCRNLFARKRIGIRWEGIHTGEKGVYTNHYICKKCGYRWRGKPHTQPN